ncbi:hypothetical protein [Sediminibacillus massiliensis]|uniref:hypothetical protein n=1 Tax=Sediminibacillus massiliensis TaxID=1926277 RepID=UPI0009886869|nr:hypothetical protein [Sediminibacillus massiliensis]
MKKSWIICLPLMALFVSGCQNSTTAEVTDNQEDTNIEEKLDLSVEDIEKPVHSEEEMAELTEQLFDLYESDRLGWGNPDLPSLEIAYGGIVFQIPVLSSDKEEQSYLGTFFMGNHILEGDTVLGEITKAPKDKPDWKGKSAKLEKINDTTARLTIDDIASYQFTAMEIKKLSSLYGSWTDPNSSDKWELTEGLASNLHITSNKLDEIVLALFTKEENTFIGTVQNIQEGPIAVHTGEEAALQVIDENHLVLSLPDERQYELQRSD